MEEDKKKQDEDRRTQEDEKNQVKDLVEHFEEKKDQIRKEAKNLPTPVNSPNVEFKGDSPQKKDNPQLNRKESYSEREIVNKYSNYNFLS